MQSIRVGQVYDEIEIGNFFGRWKVLSFENGKWKCEAFDRVGRIRNGTIHSFEEYVFSAHWMQLNKEYNVRQVLNKIDKNENK